MKQHYKDYYAVELEVAKRNLLENSRKQDMSSPLRLSREVETYSLTSVPVWARESFSDACDHLEVEIAWTLKRKKDGRAWDHDPELVDTKVLSIKQMKVDVKVTETEVEAFHFNNK